MKIQCVVVAVAMLGWAAGALAVGPATPGVAFYRTSEKDEEDARQVDVPFQGKLDGTQAVSVGGWFFPRRRGEQTFLGRGVIETAPGGERMFRPAGGWVNFTLGTDARGFLTGTINGNGEMPFPYVTLDEVPEQAWSQLVVVKEPTGVHRFYRNGAKVHENRDSAGAGKVWPFDDKAVGEPLRFGVPLGGKVGEAWVLARELSDAEVKADFEEKRARYKPTTTPAKPIGLRRMFERPIEGRWTRPLTKETWPAERERILRGVHAVTGRSDAKRVDIEVRVETPDVDCGTYVRRKVSIPVEAGDRMPMYLLVPKGTAGRRVPAVICMYGTTGGAGKETTVGLSGPTPGTPVKKNRAFAVDVVEAGMVAVAPDYLRDGERVKPGERPYETTSFYARHPDWSCVGKDVWDTSRAIDYLETLPFVDGSRIGMIGHSYGGHTTIFAAALEDRIKVAVASGPVSDFRGHGMHWGVPKGAGSSQSLPGMRPYVLDHALPIPVEFYEWTALIAPRPLLVLQAVGERRPHEEENAAAVGEVYRTLGAGEDVRYLWTAGDHDFPPVARRAAVEWLKAGFAK